MSSLPIFILAKIASPILDRISTGSFWNLKCAGAILAMRGSNSINIACWMAFLKPRSIATSQSGFKDDDDPRQFRTNNDKCQTHTDDAVTVSPDQRGSHGFLDLALGTEVLVFAQSWPSQFMVAETVYCWRSGLLLPP